MEHNRYEEWVEEKDAITGHIIQILEVKKNIFKILASYSGSSLSKIAYTITSDPKMKENNEELLDMINDELNNRI